jgi:hypothetical protein
MADGHHPAAREFEHHMDPEIWWVDNPDFDAEFARLAGGEQKENTVAAHTNAVDPVSGASTAFPAFINIRFEDGRAIVTMRGDPVKVEEDGDNSEYHKAGKQTEATFLQHDWDQFIAEATRERGLVPGG